MVRGTVFLKLLTCNFKEFIRDFGSVFFTFAFPCFFVIAIGVQERFSKPFSVTCGVVAESQSVVAQQLVAAIRDRRFLVPERLSLAEGMAGLKEGRVKFLLVLPDKGVSPVAPKAQLIADSSIAGFARMAVDAARADLYGENQHWVAPFEYEAVVPAGRSVTDFSFIFPGMLAMALLQLGLFATAAPILRARDRGTLRHLSLTPLSSLAMVGSQLVLRLAISALQIGLLLAAGIYLTHTPMRASLPLLATALLGAAMLISVGYAIAGLAPTIDSGMTVIMLANFAMLFGGNVFWDVKEVHFLRPFALAMPVTYVADMFRQILSGVSGLLPLWVDTAVVLGWTVLAIGIALKTFRFDMERC